MNVLPIYILRRQMGRNNSSYVFKCISNIGPMFDSNFTTNYNGVGWGEVDSVSTQ